MEVLHVGELGKYLVSVDLFEYRRPEANNLLGSTEHFTPARFSRRGSMTKRHSLNIPTRQNDSRR